MRPQTFAEAEFDQGTRGIGRQLNAGAGLFEPLGLLPDDDTEAVASERQRRSQPGDAGASDDDGA
jgi:hypothetical protein